MAAELNDVEAAAWTATNVMGWHAAQDPAPDGPRHWVDTNGKSQADMSLSSPDCWDPLGSADDALKMLDAWCAKLQGGYYHFRLATGLHEVQLYHRQGSRMHYHDMVDADNFMDAAVAAVYEAETPTSQPGE